MADAVSAPRAAVDVGSNSVRLLVLGADGARLTREMTITRLGTGVDRNGHLDDEALARTLETITRYQRIWSELGVVDRVRIAATSAVRDAADRDRFLDAVQRLTGVRPEVLDGQQEAALAFAGATGGVEVARPAAVLDIGGGSTELVVGSDDGTVRGSASMQLGCVRVTERDLHDDPPTTGQLAAARRTIAAELDLADRVLEHQGVSPHTARALVAVAGTATTLGALYLGLPAYEESLIHGVRLPAAELDVLTDRLVRMSARERATLGPMQPGREDVIHAGALVLAAVVARYDVPEVVVSERDNLDGLAASLG